MISYILRFRLILYTIIGFLVIEACFVFLIPKTPWDHPIGFIEGTLLENNNRAKFVIAEKMSHIKKNKFDIIQVGGSSGLHASQPNIVNTYLKDKKYFNLSCCRDTSFQGYRFLLEAALKSTKAKISVLYLSPLSLPSPTGNPISSELGDSIYDSYLGPWSNIKTASQNWRYYIVNKTFNPNNPEWSNNPLGKHKILLDNTMTLQYLTPENIQQHIKNDSGWLPHYDVITPTSETWTKAESEYFLKEIQYFEEMLEKYDAKMYMIFNPSPYNSNILTQELETIIEKGFSKLENIKLITKFNTFWELEMFNDDVHLNSKGSAKASHRIGKLLQENL